MRNEAIDIVNAAINAADPYNNTREILSTLFSDTKNDITVMAIGKAAVPMARAADEILRGRIKSGLLVTKYHHSEGFYSENFEVIEAGHPISDCNSLLAAEKGLSVADTLNENDTLLVLLSGGGSALFEKSIIPAEEQQTITRKLLSRGAAIEEINALRKRLSLVKGGKLAAAAYPAKVITIALSDVLSNDKGVIASGITVKSTDSTEFIKQCTEKYLPDISEVTKSILLRNDGLIINDGGYYFAGDINILCDAAEKRGRELGYTVHPCKRDLTGEAREEAIRIINSIPSLPGKHLFVFGGETVVTLKGNGKGGRNQEKALSAAIKLKNTKNICFISVGSDGTDGPTDAAGGFADGNTYNLMKASGISPEKELSDNNSYLALEAADSLIITGPTGTNVNDITVILTDYEEEKY